MACAEDIISKARECIGTPYHHQARMPQVGMDCMGLVIWVMRQLGTTIIDRSNYSPNISPYEFLRSIRDHWPEKRIVNYSSGDLLLISPRKLLQHAAIAVNKELIIHCDHVNGVEERRLDDWAERICYCFDLTSPL